VEEIKKNKGSKLLLAASALMTTSMLGQKDTVVVLQEEGLRDSVKIMFGGAPVSQKWIAEIGADATAENAADAARVALGLMK
jgi:monomethylamine corrinoid protein